MIWLHKTIIPATTFPYHHKARVWTFVYRTEKGTVKKKVSLPSQSMALHSLWSNILLFVSRTKKSTINNNFIVRKGALDRNLKHTKSISSSAGVEKKETKLICYIQQINFADWRHKKQIKLQCIVDWIHSGQPKLKDSNLCVWLKIQKYKEVWQQGWPQNV